MKIPKKRLKHVAVYLDDYLHARLLEIAEESEISLSETIRWFITEGLRIMDIENRGINGN